MKNSLTGTEITAMVKELQVLVGGKIDKIYQPGEKELLFQIHVTSQGKMLLRVVLGKFLYLTSSKLEQEEPSEFCLRLRKLLSGGRIRALRQYQGQRVVELDIEFKEGGYRVVIELFSSGNLIVTDPQGVILLAQEYPSFAARQIKPKMPYVYPPSQLNWADLFEKEFKALLKSTTRDKLVLVLAMDLGLGGVYAEEVCLSSGLDKNLPPSKVNQHQASKIIDTLKELRKRLETPKGIVYESNDIVPIELGLYSSLSKKEYPTFSEALDAHLSVSQHEEKQRRQRQAFDKKVQKIQAIVDAQQETLKRLEQRAADDQRRGELIFEQYQHLKSITEKIQELIKKEGWEETAKKLKKGKIVKAVNAKEKKIALEL